MKAASVVLNVLCRSQDTEFSIACSFPITLFFGSLMTSWLVNLKLGFVISSQCINVRSGRMRDL